MLQAHIRHKKKGRPKPPFPIEQIFNDALVIGLAAQESRDVEKIGIASRKNRAIRRINAQARLNVLLNFFVNLIAHITRRTDHAKARDALEQRLGPLVDMSAPCFLRDGAFCRQLGHAHIAFVAW